jgi:sigma-B regulation protein RsbQ
VFIMDILARNNVNVTGRGPMVFAHGFGFDQNMWRFVAPEFENDFKVVLFDHVGAGGSDLPAYDKSKYSSLHGYADDLFEIGRDLGLKDAVFVGVQACTGEEALRLIDGGLQPILSSPITSCPA